MDREKNLMEGIDAKLCEHGFGEAIGPKLIGGTGQVLSSNAAVAAQKSTKAAIQEIKKYANKSGKTLTPTMVAQMQLFILNAVSSAMAYYDITESGEDDGDDLDGMDSSR